MPQENGVDQWITTETLRDHVVQTQILNDIITEASTISNLDNPSVVKTYKLGLLRGRIPLMSSVEGYMNVGELAKSEIKRATYKDFDFQMYKDRVKIGISDEAEMDQTVGNAFEMQKHAAALTLADMMEQRIAAQLINKPQTATYDASKKDFFKVTLKEILDKFAPYSPTACIMTTGTSAAFWGALNDGYTGMATFASDNKIPYTNTKLVVSDYVEETADEPMMYFTCSSAPGIGVAKGAIKTRLWEDKDAGGTIFQIDTWRTSFSRILTVPNPINPDIETERLNKAVVAVKIENLEPVDQKELLFKTVASDGIKKTVAKKV